MDINRKYVNNKTHNYFYSYKLSNMGHKGMKIHFLLDT